MRWRKPQRFRRGWRQPIDGLNRRYGGISRSATSSEVMRQSRKTPKSVAIHATSPPLRRRSNPMERDYKIGCTGNRHQPVTLQGYGIPGCPRDGEVLQSWRWGWAQPCGRPGWQGDALWERQWPIAWPSSMCFPESIAGVHFRSSAAPFPHHIGRYRHLPTLCRLAAVGRVCTRYRYTQPDKTALHSRNMHALTLTHYL